MGIRNTPGHDVRDVVCTCRFVAGITRGPCPLGLLSFGLWDTGTGCLSVQVLQEFFVTVTRKVADPLTADEAAHRIEELCAWKVFAPTSTDIVQAIALHSRAQVSVWDAMVLHAAAELGCDVLWTEDLSDGQRVHGVHICNPFRMDG